MRYLFIAMILAPIYQLHANPIIVENSKNGTAGWWLKKPALLHEIEGFAGKTSIEAGEKIDIFVNTTASSYTWELFRLGYYQGIGARKIIQTTTQTAINQPPCDQDLITGLVDCNWQKSFTIQTSMTWVSGVYLVRLTELATKKDSLVLFVVRNDSRAADLVYTHSVNTDAAYNRWGGKDLYNGAVKVSLNRPIIPPPFSPDQDPVGTGDFFAYYDYNLVRWLEKQGYDTKYITNVDTHEDYQRFASSNIFLSVGHDEYWSAQMRSNLNQYRDLGRSILFLSGNTMYWQIRFEPDARGNPNRIITCYKSAENDPETDPSKKTVRFRDPPLNFPEDEIMGVLHDGDFPVDNDIKIRDASHWVFTGTGLRDGDLIPKMLGYETDRMLWNAPLSTQRLAATNFVAAHGGLNYSDMIIYRSELGGYVFAPGSMQWIWGLDDLKMSTNTERGFKNLAVQTITRNIIDRILYERCEFRPYPTEKVVLDLRFADTVGTTHFRDNSAYGRSVLCFSSSCPLLVADQNVSQALFFDRHGVFVDLGIESSIRGRMGFSIAFSIKLEPSLDTFVILQQRDEKSSTAYKGYDGSFQISVDESGSVIFWTYSLDNEHALWMRSSKSLKDGLWHNVVISRLSSGAGVISIDNVEDTYRNVPFIDDLKPHTMYLGHDPLGQRGLVGHIGSLKIWNH